MISENLTLLQQIEDLQKILYGHSAPDSFHWMEAECEAVKQECNQLQEKVKALEEEGVQRKIVLDNKIKQYTEEMRKQNSAIPHEIWGLKEKYKHSKALEESFAVAKAEREAVRQQNDAL